MQVGFLWPVGAVEAGPIVIKILPFASEAVDIGRSRVEMAGKQLLLLAQPVVLADEQQEKDEQQQAEDGSCRMAIVAGRKGEDHREEGACAQRHIAAAALLELMDGTEVSLTDGFIEVPFLLGMFQRKSPHTIIWMILL